ncbi:MAG: CpaE family protein, partial [Thermaurantiacus sp.]
MNEVAARPIPRMERLSAATFTGNGIRLDPIAFDGTARDLPAALGSDALVVLLDPTDEAAVAAVTARARLADAPPVIAVVNGLTVNDTRRLLREGVTDVLPGPLSLPELEAAMEQLRGSARAGRRGDAGQLVAFFGTGGSGATSLAVQSAIELARTVRTCLIDFDVQRGAAALQLDLKPALTLLDLITAGERLDAEVLQSVAAEHASGLAVVACPPEILPLEDLTPAIVDRVLAVARRLFPLVILDLPPEWTDWKIRAVERADLGLLVARPSVLGVHQCRRILPLLEANRIADNVQLVANRVQRALFREADLSEQETVLRRAYAFRVADDAD